MTNEDRLMFKSVLDGLEANRKETHNVSIKVAGVDQKLTDHINGHAHNKTDYFRWFVGIFIVLTFLGSLVTTAIMAAGVLQQYREAAKNYQPPPAIVRSP